MTQNRSSAVMQQRAEPHDSLDFFPTPPWATRALIEQLKAREMTAPLVHESQTVWEPACGEGHMARPLGETFRRVLASDVCDYGWGHEVDDFLMPRPPIVGIDWIITNPPFKLGAEFARTALDRTRMGVALFCRSAFLEGEERFHTLFAVHRPALILQFAERVPVVKGRYDPDASSATAYSWIVWLSQWPNMRPEFGWIAPCRKRLFRAGDVEPEAVPQLPAEALPLFAEAV